MCFNVCGEKNTHLFHVFCSHKRLLLRDLPRLLLLSRGPNTRAAIDFSMPKRYICETMPAHERRGSCARTLARRAATCTSRAQSCVPTCRRSHSSKRTRPSASLRAWCSDLRVVKGRVGALAFALQQRPARAVVQDFLERHLLHGRPRHARVCTVATSAPRRVFIFIDEI